MLRPPAVSLADYLASKGWDVWTCELRGNGLSDKPQLFSARGTQWTIDDYVEKDVPAIIRFVLKESKAQQVHFLGHSMVGVAGCGVKLVFTGWFTGVVCTACCSCAGTCQLLGRCVLLATSVHAAA